MAFEIVEITPNTYHLQSGANSGLLTQGGEAILIDCGLDDDAGRRIKKALESHHLHLAALIITHGHADHFGGAAYLRRQLPRFTVCAPSIEAAFIANPSLEGIMLSAGAQPFQALKGKFTLASACAVDDEILPGVHTIAGISFEVVSLAGHSPNQMGVRCGDVLFTADAFLPTVTLAKYPVPFTVHMGHALNVLYRLDELRGVTFAPGHGTHLPASGTEARAVIAANRGALQAVIDATAAAIAVRRLDEGAITRVVCEKLGDGLATPVSYYLARTAIQAALVYLHEEHRAMMDVGGVWAPVP